MIPAAPSSAPPAPRALEHLRVPPAELVLGEGVGGQVADLQPGELPHEVPERHPAGEQAGAEARPRLGNQLWIQLWLTLPGGKSRWEPPQTPSQGGELNAGCPVVS